MPMHALEFQRKWRDASVKERSGAQEHFIDICRLVGAPTPVEADPAGDFYAFEKGAEKLAGGGGWADVWYRDHFAWEYKGRGRDLAKAYQQLNQYRENLENPPLLIVSDLDTIEVHTNFTGTIKQVHRITLDTITEDASLQVLRALFFTPQSLRPTITPESVTKEAAERFGELAKSIQSRGNDPQEIAHFLVQLLFCLFAEDIGLLPNRVFSRMLEFARQNPQSFRAETQRLLETMGSGGNVAYERVPHFNGGLFRDVTVLKLTPAEIDELDAASHLDWSQVEPAIFGTLFERSLDPVARARYGIHYTGRDDIFRVVDPVVLQPLRRRWEAVKAEIASLVERRNSAKSTRIRNERQRDIMRAVDAFTDELAAVRILDPACGSGNFLYVALKGLLDLEKEVLTYAAAEAGLPMGFPKVGPHQVLGLEINAYAQELAQVVIWIGYLQWMIGNGFGWREPVLRDLETIRLQDALLEERAGKVQRTVWPAADYIIGNPPFLGAKRLRTELGDTYVESLFGAYGADVPGNSDLCCYFFEQASIQVGEGNTRRVGLLATNSIRKGGSNEVLRRIKHSADIFMAWSDEPWVLDGASVRISIIGFDNGAELERTLDGETVAEITSDLKPGLNLSFAVPLLENRGLSFRGIELGGNFEVPQDRAHQFLRCPLNPNGQPNSDVVTKWATVDRVLKGRGDHWIIDFGVDMTEDVASLYEAPFEYASTHIRPERVTNRSKRTADNWWIHRRSAPPLREAIRNFDRYIATPLVSRYRLFGWIPANTLPVNRLVAFARNDDYFFGVLHSRVHEVWALEMGPAMVESARPITTRCASRPSTSLGRRGRNRRATPASRQSRGQRRRSTNCARTGSTRRTPAGPS
ncbi:hypothetical protein BH24GEM2_BH24GEM2_14060 [soil metagenome]